MKTKRTMRDAEVHNVINLARQTITRYINERWRCWNKSYTFTLRFFRLLRYDRIIIKYGHIFHGITFTCVFVLRSITSFISLENEKLSIRTPWTFTETETSNLNKLTSSGAFLLGYLYPLKKIYIILRYRVLQTHDMNFNNLNAISELFREHQLKSFTLGIQDNQIYGLHMRLSYSILINFCSKVRILLVQCTFICTFMYISLINIFALVKILIVLSISYTRRDRHLRCNLKSNFMIAIIK